MVAFAAFLFICWMLKKFICSNFAFGVTMVALDAVEKKLDKELAK